jgi:hypothetical protein
MKLTYEQAQTALAGLRILLADGPTDPGCGICWNLGAVLEYRQDERDVDSYELVSRMAVDWPGRTGEVYSAEDVQRSCYPIYRKRYEPLWDGEQLIQRRSLMLYMIQQLEAVL